MLLNYCMFGFSCCLLIMFFNWNTEGMTFRVTLVSITLLTIFGIYKAVRIIAKETSDKVEFDDKKAIHHKDLDIRKTRILIAAEAPLYGMLIGVIGLMKLLPVEDDMPLWDAPKTVWMWFIGIDILFILVCFALNRIDKKLERLFADYKFFGRDAIRISYAKNGNTPLPAGCSKYGGRPDVADDFQWPHDDSGLPLSLLLQIDCADLAPLDHEGLLPVSGHLYFFYELSRMRRNGQENNVRVIYNDKPSSQLHSLDFPVNLDKKHQLQECRLQYTRCKSLPRLEDLRHLKKNPFKDDEDDESEYYDRFLRLYDKFWAGDGPIGKMLGYADLLQGSIIRDISDEVLLLELYTSEIWQENGKTPHDLPLGCGYIYFYITREDLQARRFDSITFALQRE